MSPMEIVLGWVYGSIDPPPSPLAGETIPTPREALEREILPALQRPPCGVTFSGGRDSATILALAVHVARREGLPAPIPITRVFPDAPETDESTWQELVIEHLGIDDWVKLPIHDELDLVGPFATGVLKQHGVVWPPLMISNIPALQTVRGGSLLTGEYGDEVLGVDSHRVAPLMRAVRTPRAVRRRHLRAMAEAVAPARARVHLELNDPDAQQRWLRAPAVEALRQHVWEQERSRPLGFAASLRAQTAERNVALAEHNEQILAGEHEVALSQPLGSELVTEALATDGGWLGRGFRTTNLRRFVGDLLPDAVLARTDKVFFDATFMIRLTKEFAQEWSGEGVDEDMVDAELLREIWLSDERPGQTGALLQSAWLATNVRS